MADLVTEVRKEEEIIWPDFMADLLAIKALILVLKRQNWVRIQISKETPEKAVKKLANICSFNARSRITDTY